MAVDFMERVGAPTREHVGTPDAAAGDRHWLPGVRAIQALTMVGCRWPIGEVADETFRFCGEARARGSYCAVHRSLAYAGGSR